MNFLNKLTTNKVVVLAAILILSWILVDLYVTNKISAVKLNVETKIQEQQIKLTSQARTIFRDEADSALNQIILDCELDDRVRFDDLLSELSELKSSELIELSNLFDVCGGFYEDRRAIMAVRFSREVEILANYVSILKEVDNNTETLDADLVAWTELSNVERERSQLMRHLVAVQEQIIDQLIAGESTDSESVAELLKEAQTTLGNVYSLNEKASQLRAELINV